MRNNIKELSLNILDIAENSIRAGADLIKISLTEEGALLTVTVEDNGCGMGDEVLQNVQNPLYTTRNTRHGGMGIPLFKAEAEKTGGHFKIVSKTACRSHGTAVTATFRKNHPNFKPIGKIEDTVAAVITGNPDGDLIFTHKTQNGEVLLDTRSLRRILNGVPLNHCEVIGWVKKYLKKQYRLLQNI